MAFQKQDRWFRDISEAFKEGSGRFERLLLRFREIQGIHERSRRFWSYCYILLKILY